MFHAYAPHTFEDVVFRLLLAALCGMVLGADREFRRKPAGLRTHALVAIGTSLGTVVALQFGPPSVDAASRIVQGIVAGIGFIGGGVILHRSDANVEGVTTAASLWVVAAIGIAAGSGLWRESLVAVALTLLVLTAGERLDILIRRLRDRHEAQPPLEPPADGPRR
jgi:putative Mg2+ transporter-C (MgtC) family protein